MNCQICGAELPEGAMFCGECGSSTTATAATRRRQDSRPADTTIIHPLPRTPGVVSVPVTTLPAQATVGPVGAVEGAPDERGDANAPLVQGGRPAGSDATSDTIASRDESAPVVPVAGAAPVAPVAPAAGVARVAPSPAVSPALGADAVVASGARTSADAESAATASAAGPSGTGATQRAQQPVQAPRPTVRFVLQFSTGETVVVHGTGLIGRRPLPQPSEHYDHLIQIADVGMSVSKTHLEFGQHDGEFWVSDRFSGNGTAIRRPDEAAHRCEPGRRYLVPRGSRVEMADQFFMVI